MTIYTVRVVGADGSVGQGCTVCTTSSCLYVHQVTHVSNNYSISVTSINQDGALGSQNIITFSEFNLIILPYAKYVFVYAHGQQSSAILCLSKQLTLCT